MAIGIDPGHKGALVVVSRGEVVYCDNIPIMAAPQGKKGRWINDRRFYSLMCTIRQAYDETVYLEMVRAMPSQGPRARKMGAQSSFNFGQGFGSLYTVCAITGAEPVLVEAAAWKRRAGLIGLPKRAALDLARDLYPDAPLAHGRGFGTEEAATGRADALLIARFGGPSPEDLL